MTKKNIEDEPGRRIARIKKKKPKNQSRTFKKAYKMSKFAKRSAEGNPSKPPKLNYSQRNRLDFTDSMVDWPPAGEPGYFKPKNMPKRFESLKQSRKKGHPLLVVRLTVDLVEGVQGLLGRVELGPDLFLRAPARIELVDRLLVARQRVVVIVRDLGEQPLDLHSERR